MRHTGLLLVLLLSGFLTETDLLRAQSSTADRPKGTLAETYGPTADSLILAATRDSAAYRRLGELVDRFGSRFSGSTSLEAAIDWILAQMKSDGLAQVRGEPVMVPHWVRGSESAWLIKPRRTPLAMLGLGGSVADAWVRHYRSSAGSQQLR